MRKYLPIALSILLFVGCKPKPEPEPEPIPGPPEPEGTAVKFTETNDLFPNPERGAYVQVYYTSADLSTHASSALINNNRTSDAFLTLYLHSYYLTDYMESDIPQEFLDRLDSNMNALRGGGAKAVLRFSYKSSMSTSAKPWNATPEWIHRHIDQVGPYLQKHSDVILCVQCGWLGSWGEWYYTDSGYKQNPAKDSDYEMRWEVLEHMLDVVPTDRQIGLRIPAYKMRYLRMRGDSTYSPLTASEAFQPTAKARICGHNDCFVSSSNDVGTYRNQADREFWAEDSKYTIMGGETCEKCSFSNSENAISEMEKYHWTYLNRDYRETVTSMWKAEGSWKTMLRRLGYRLALSKIILTTEPRAGEKYEVYFVLNNRGFAAPMNKRDLELVFVSTCDPTQKFVYPQTEDPRFWLPGEHRFTLGCTLDPNMEGEYDLYLNLPDPYPSLHNDPRYSIRLANSGMWDSETGYNYLTSVAVEKTAY
ncbi:MAG: DUF4832 domain-containing protein [Paludibacteraceae bacterium]|nr:DUF4832 domain-containing protein [Paludibacteraceae bacterium]